MKLVSKRVGETSTTCRLNWPSLAKIVLTVFDQLMLAAAKATLLQVVCIMVLDSKDIVKSNMDPLYVGKMLIPQLCRGMTIMLG